MRLGAVTAVLLAAAVLTGCARQPQLVTGAPAPVTPVPTATPVSPTATATGTPTAPAGPSRTPSRPAATTSPPPAVPTLPTAYTSLEFTDLDTTVRLPVPVGWTKTRTARGYDFGDPTETLLLRAEITARTGADARSGLTAYEPTVAASLPNYRRAGIADVSGVGDSAVDWTFTFTGVQKLPRRVIDRMIVSGPAGIAVYFSALDRDYAAVRGVWNEAVNGLVIS